MSKYIIYDISNIVISGSYGFGKKLNYYGFPTGGIYSLLRTFSKYESKQHLKEKGLYHIFCYESKIKTFKKNIYSSYKENRVSVGSVNRSITNVQIKWIEDFANNCNIMCIQKDGYEADDLIYSAVIDITKDDSDAEFIIVSSDSDYASLTNITNKISFEAVGGNSIVPNKYEIITKIIYGDRGDNVTSCIPQTLTKKHKEIFTTNLYRYFEDRMDKMLKYNFNGEEFLNDLNVPDDVRNKILENIFLIHPIIIGDLNIINNIKEVNKDNIINYLNSFGMKKIMKTLYGIERNYENEESKSILYRALNLLNPEVIKYFTNEKYTG